MDFNQVKINTMSKEVVVGCKKRVSNFLLMCNVQYFFVVLVLPGKHLVFFVHCSFNHHRFLSSKRGGSVSIIMKALLVNTSHLGFTP